MKKIIFYIVLVALSLFGHYKYFTTELVEDQPFLMKTGIRCGVVESTFTELRNVKHGTTTDYFLMVKYGTNLVVEDVSAKTWYSTKEKETICFNNTEGISILLILNLGASIIIAFFWSVVGIWSFLRWIFDRKPYYVLSDEEN